MGNIKLISGRGRNSKNRARNGRATGAQTAARPTARPTTRTAAQTGGKTVAKESVKAVPKTDVKPNARRKTRTITTIVILVIFLGGITALVLSLGYYVRNLDTIYPNVWADGIKLSGMTLEEARLALIDSGYESNASDVSATIVFPDRSSFTITGDEVGFSLNAEEAANAAYNYGRDGTFFQSNIAYIKAMLNRTDLSDLSSGNFDEDFVRGVASEHTKSFNDALVEDFFDMNAEFITVVKGTGVKPADEQSVFELAVATIKKALEEQAHLTVEYVPEILEAVDVDLGLLYSTIHVDPVNSTYDPETFSATESFSGVSFDLPAAQAKLDRAAVGERVAIELFPVEPEVTQEMVQSMLFRDVLSERTTDVAGTSNRQHNVQLAASFINGLLMNPDDVFSFNGTVGRRTEERGFKEANAYASGEIVQEIGGGKCPVSSTTYEAVLYADLAVVERREHGMTVSYVQLGNDATVDWSSIDFKFRNSTEYPIRIETELVSRKLTVRLIGTKLDDHYIDIKYEQISRTPFEEVTREDPSVRPGHTVTENPGHVGYVVDTYKYIYDSDDNLISRTLVCRSRYRVQNKVILIPVPVEPTTPPPDPSSSPSPSSPPDPPPGTSPDPSASPPPDPSPGTSPDPSPSPPIDPSPSPTFDPPPGSDRQNPDE